MSPVQRPVTGSTLTFALADELQIVRQQLGTSPRTARTLAKNGALRATLVGLAAGGELASHSAEGPITVHVLEGAIDFDVEGQIHALRAGSLLALDAGIVHAVRSPEGGVFLLTVSAG